MRAIWRAFGYAFQGLRAATIERAFRQELMVLSAALPVAVWVAPNRLSLAVMVMSVLLVPIVELLNTGIEAAIDRQSLECHPLAKKAKDVAAAAVLLSIVNAIAVWGIILV